MNFEELVKPSKESVEENNSYLWAKRIFKTKINQDLTPDFKDKIKSVFQHLTKDELIDKLLSNQMLQTKPEVAPSPVVVKKKKKR